MNSFREDLTALRLPDVSCLSGASVLVTGATGLVGSAFVELLLLRVPDVKVYAGCRSRDKYDKRFADYLSDGRLRYFHVDVSCPVQSELRFDYMVHAASNASPAAYSLDPVGTMKGNMLGVINLLEYGREHGLKRFLYISSGEVYGEGDTGKWMEEDSGFVDSMDVRSCYPSSKRAAETFCAAYSAQYGIETCVARLSHCYGPCYTAADNRVYAQFLRNARNGEDIVMKSRGEQFRSWIYVADCAAALLYVLVKGCDRVAYNVADEASNVSIAKLAETIASLAGTGVVFEMDTPIKGATNVKRAVFDTSRLQALGWKTSFDLRTGLQHTIESI